MCVFLFCSSFLSDEGESLCSTCYSSYGSVWMKDVVDGCVRLELPLSSQAIQCDGVRTVARPHSPRLQRLHPRSAHPDGDVMLEVQRRPHHPTRLCDDDEEARGERDDNTLECGSLPHTHTPPVDRTIFERSNSHEDTLILICTNYYYYY